MKIAVMIIAGLVLVGCSSTSLTPQEMALIQAQAEQQTLTISCETGCTFSYKDPRDKASIPRQTNGWDATIAMGQSLERVVSGAVPVVGMGYLGVEAVKALRGSGAVTTTTTIGDYSGASSGRVGDYSGDQSGNRGTLGDYSGQQSGNGGTLYSDIPGRIHSPDDSTHEPTVVQPPDPVIVHGSAP